MDTKKMGAFIRETRKDRGMTQKDLGELLHITDRAVSKWERGLCAPDIATLEPLSRALGITVTELIAGEHLEKSHAEKESGVQTALDYSVQEQNFRVRRCKRHILSALTCVVLAAAMVWSILWAKGVFSIAAQSTSPDGRVNITVYDRDMTELWTQNRTTVSEQLPEGMSTTIYGGRFDGLWWAPDSGQYVLRLAAPEGTRTVLRRPGSAIELDAYLPLVMGGTGLPMDRRDTRYRFIQWGTDSDSMLFHYIYTGSDTITHQGYFWLRLSDGSISAVYEVQNTQ